MDTQTVILAISIFCIGGALFYWLSAKLTHAKMQPMLEAQMRISKLAEDKLHHAQQARNDATKAAENAQTELKAQHAKELDAAKVRHAELEKAKTEVEQQRQTTLAEMATLREEAASKVVSLLEQMTALDKTVVDKDHRIALVEMQNEPLQQRILDIEKTLLAEKGQSEALQTALDSRQKALEAQEQLATQIKQQLAATIHAVDTEKQAAAERETQLRHALSEHERRQAAGMSQSGELQLELDKLKQAMVAAETDAEAKQAELKRRLTQSDSTIQKLQKEIMTIVGSGAGGPGDAAAVATLTEDLEVAQERARMAEKKIIELESRGAAPDSDLRKRLRESEYRVCELEFKLTEAEEARDRALRQNTQ